MDLLLDQFQEVSIPRAVEAELQSVPDRDVRTAIDEAKRRGWLKLLPASDAALVSLLSLELHPGEAEAIALALEMKANIYSSMNEKAALSLASWVCR